MSKLFFSLSYCLLVVLFISEAQTGPAVSKNTMEKNPVLCDPQEGVCAFPGQNVSDNPVTPAVKPLTITYFTDPICSSCWGIEPQLRKLKLEYGDYIHIDYRMGGLLPSWDVYNSGGISKPADVAHHWDEVSRYYDMPIDGDVWIEDPLPSSYPPSVAFKAAQMQDEVKAVLFLRELRELLFLQKKNITKWEYVQQAAESAGLDTVRLKSDFEGFANRLFQDDLNLARQLGVRGFPTLLFSDANGNQVKLYGFKPYEEFEKAVLHLNPAARKKKVDVSVENLFSHYPTLTTKEFAVLAGKSRENAEKELQGLFDRKQLTVIDTKNGRLWVATASMK